MSNRNEGPLVGVDVGKSDEINGSMTRMSNGSKFDRVCRNDGSSSSDPEAG